MSPRVIAAAHQTLTAAGYALVYSQRRGALSSVGALYRRGTDRARIDNDGVRLWEEVPMLPRGVRVGSERFVAVERLAVELEGRAA